MAKKKKKNNRNGTYKVETHFFPGSTDSERKSFGEGVESGRENPYLHSYFVGVGYAKGAKREALGFKNEKQKKRFEAGMAEHEQHFVTFNKNKRSCFFARLKAFFAGFKSNRANEEADLPKLRKMKVEGKEMTLRRTQGKMRYKGLFPNLQKFKKRKVEVKGKEMTLKRNADGRSYRITGGTHVNKKKSAKRMTAKRRK